MQPAYAAAYPLLYRRHWWWRVRERILVRTIRRVMSGTGDAKILDIGCGAGLFFDALQEFGHVEGMESDLSAIEASGHWRHRIHPGELGDGGDKYDLILLLDVLEHVSDPQALVRTVAGRLTDRGRIVVTVPAYDFLWTSHDVLNQHLRRYTAGTLRATIHQAGLATRESRYLFQSLVIPKLFVRLKEAVLRAEGRVPHIPSRPLNAAIYMWFRVEDVIAGWLPFGSSVLAVAERRR